MSTGLVIFTLTHVAISLVGIGAGLVVMVGMLGGRSFDRWSAVFLISTLATSVTGFLFPFHGFLPSHAVGILSMVLLPMALFARYRAHLAGLWRPAYVITSMIALYLNVFVLVVQAFLKVPALHEMAPKQNEPPFLITQLAVLLAFVALTILAAVRFRRIVTRTENPL